MSRPTFDEIFMSNAFLWAKRGTCNRLNVGAVIVRENQPIASGYNGSVSGDEHCIDVGCKVIDHHCVRTIHAEENAILQCSRLGVSTLGTTIYVTHFPCLKCSKDIIRAGISKVIYAEDYKNDAYAGELFRKSGVEVIQLTKFNT